MEQTQRLLTWRAGVLLGAYSGLNCAFGRMKDDRTPAWVRPARAFDATTLHAELTRRIPRSKRRLLPGRAQARSRHSPARCVCVG
jgi:hypothetical protein